MRKINAIKACEVLNDHSENCMFNEDFFKVKEVAQAVNYLKKKYGFTPIQTVLVSIMAARDEEVEMSEIYSWLGISRLRFLSYFDEIQQLVKEGVILRPDDVKGVLLLSDEITKALLHDSSYKKTNYHFENLNDALTGFYSWYASMEESEISQEQLINRIPFFWENNQHIPFFSELNRFLNEDKDNIFILFLLLYLSCRVVIDKENNADMDFISLRHERVFYQHIRRKINGKNAFSRLVEFGLDISGMANTRTFKLTRFALEQFLPEYVTEVKSTEKACKGLTRYDSITPKKLIYNQQEQQQVDNLVTMLQDANYSNIITRLEENGYRTGIPCLFYGGPGTGKTETVLQIARLTGRNLMQVNIASIRDKYVGETEKNIKFIFDNYRRAVNEASVNNSPCPILFFNEADALFNKRSTNTESSTDKMENSLQNILLQEMENLKGILICTTNLTSNLDAAFERRFLYKVEFQKPNTEAKAHIWREMIKEINEEEALSLAAAYDFSGGQIENIARKFNINKILFGHEPSVEEIRSYCRNELLSHTPNRRAIGFMA